MERKGYKVTGIMYDPLIAQIATEHWNENCSYFSEGAREMNTIGINHNLDRARIKKLLAIGLSGGECADGENHSEIQQSVPEGIDFPEMLGYRSKNRGL